MVDKLTFPSRDNAVQEKINEIIDNLVNTTDLATKVSKSGDTMTGGLVLNSSSLYLTGVASTVSAGTSKMYFGTPSSYYAYIGANTSGNFGIYNSAGKGVGCYPAQCLYPTNNIDLGRTNSKWKDIYASGKLYGASTDISITNLISGANKGATAIQPNDNISTLTNDVGYITSASLPTVNDATLTIQKNSSNVGTFTANASVDNIINITVPVNASDVNALPDSTLYGSSIDVSLNTTDYKLTITLKDQNGDTLNSKVVDFPIESVVVNGSYDSTNQKIVLTLQNGNTIDIPVGALIAGLQTEITSVNKLDADLVDDSTSTNKFVTSNDKTTWNGKQDAISDLSTIRSNATNGQSAYTTISGYGNIVTHNVSEFATSIQGGLADTALQPNDNISELTNNAGYITDSALTDYITTTTLETTLTDYVTNSTLTTTLTDYVETTTLATVATTGAYSDLTGTPTIPSALSDITVSAGNNITINGDTISATDTTYSDFTGCDSITAGASGLVPAPSAGDEDKFLKADGTWDTIGGGGSITVDQVYDGTSANAQSGVAMAGELANYTKTANLPLTPYYATSTTAAGVATKEVSIPAITSLQTGQIICVKPTITSTVATSKIKLNNFTAYNMRYNGANITTSTDSVVWNENWVSWFVFDGTYWQFAGHGYDNNTNTTYSAMSVSEGTTGTATNSRTVRADYLKQIIQGTKLTGLSTADNSAVVATDSILTGIGKLQTRTESAYNKAVSKADWFEIDSPLTSTYDNSGIVLGTDCYITSDGVLTGGTAWNDGIMDTVSSVNLINDYWEWNGYFKYTSISAEEELIAIDGVNDNGFLFHIKPNGDVINPDDNNKVLANVGANDWVEFNVVHQAGDTDITVTLDTVNGKVTTTTALATTTAQALYNTCWHCNSSYGIEFLVRNDESWWKTSAGGTFYPFVTRYIGAESEIFVAEYNVTSWNDIVSAYNSGKTIVCKYLREGSSSDIMNYPQYSLNYSMQVRKNTGNLILITFYFELYSISVNSTNWSISSDNILRETVQNNTEYISPYSQYFGVLSTDDYTTVYNLIDTTTGLIPDARISSNIARTSAIPDISTKQDTLVSGTNIKTINNTSLLGSGNIDTSEIFIANGTTTYNEISNALLNGKTVFYNSGNIYYQYTYSTGTEHQFASLITLYSGDIRVEYTTVNTSNTWNIATYTVANTDLSNLSSTGKTVIDGQWDFSSPQTIISTAVSLNGSTDLSYTVTLPNDGHIYEVMIRADANTGNATGNWFIVGIKSNVLTNNYIFVCGTATQAARAAGSQGTVIIPMKYGTNNLTLRRNTNYTGSTQLFSLGYRRVGTNA